MVDLAAPRHLLTAGFLMTFFMGFPQPVLVQIQDCATYDKTGPDDSCGVGYHSCPENDEKCCVDIKCEKAKCGLYSECEESCDDNVCSCRNGFRSRSRKTSFKNDQENDCEDIDECKENAYICSPNGSCINTEGDFHCKCKPGYGKSIKDDKKLCRDINECNENPCDKTANCSNSDGSYSCYCSSGYFQYSEGELEDSNKIKCKEFSCHMPSQDSCTAGKTVLCNITTQLGSLCSSPPTVSSQKDSKEQLRNTLNLLDELVTLMKDEENHQVATEMMQLMEALLRVFAFALPSGITTISSNNNTELSMLIRSAENTSQDLVQLRQNETQMELNWKAASKKGEAFTVVGLLSYKNLGPVLADAHVEGTDWEKVGKSAEWAQAEGKPTYKVLSRVASAFVGQNESTLLSSPVTFSFSHQEPDREPDMKVICAFWKPTAEGGHWSQEGCLRLNTSTASRTHCRCNHMTSFAVLMAFYDVQDQGLNIITKAGLILSLICLLFSILTFLFCRTIRGIRTTIHLHLCLALFAAYIIFLLGAGKSSNTTACAVIAGLLHYFFLCVFCWMFLEGVQLYLMVVQVFNTHSLKHWHIFLVGYGLPAILVGLSAAINSKGYVNRNCWLSREGGFLWSFLAPVSIIILVNAVVFLITVWKLSKKFADINPDLTKLKTQRVLIITAIAQLCILGITWIFGLFQFSNQTLLLSYLFTIFNSLQGLFIFLFHCLLKKQVRDDYYRWFCQGRRDKAHSTDKYSDFSSTAGSNTLRLPNTLKESGI